MRAWFSLPLLGLVTMSCGGSPPGPSASPPPISMATEANGCPVLRDPIARPGDDVGGDTYTSFARPFFATWCLRCHSSTLTTAAARSGAPDGFNWDVEPSVRANLDRIRLQVGVFNAMPLDGPRPTCEERRRLIRWIDAGAP